MGILLIIIITGLLFVFSIRSINHFFIANLLLVLVLPTLDRLIGGFSFSFALVKYPFLFSGFIFHMLTKKGGVRLSVLFASIPWVLFVLVLGYCSVSYSGVSFSESLTFSGLIFFPLILLVVKDQFKFEKFSYDVFNFIFIPVAIFGLIQYLLGPAFFQSIGFSLTTPNTENTYSRTFSTYIESEHMGIRPFSFLISSADYAATMFHACVWIFILKPKSKFLIFPKKYVVLLFIVGLLISQFITIILLTAMCVLLFNWRYLINRITFSNSLKFGIVSGVIVCLMLLIFPEISQRITDSVVLTRAGDGGITSLGYRVIYILKYPTLISGHIWKGYGYMFDYEVFSADAKILYFSLLTGIPAALLYIFVIGFFIKKAISKMKLPTISLPERHQMSLVYFVFITILINGLSNGHIESTAPSNYLIWILGGLTLKNY